MERLVCYEVTGWFVGKGGWFCGNDSGRMKRMFIGVGKNFSEAQRKACRQVEAFEKEFQCELVEEKVDYYSIASGKRR